MSANAIPPAAKTVIRVPAETHQRLREGAEKTGNSLKRFSAAILDYALAKFDAGEISFREPTIQEDAP